MRQALEVSEKLVADAPAVPQHRAALALSLLGSGKVRAVLQPRAAEEMFRRAIELMDALVADFPGAPIYRGDLCTALVSLAELLDRLGEHSEAEGVRRRAIDASKSLLTDTSTNVQRRAAIAKVLFQAARSTAKVAPQEAEMRYRRAIELEEALVDEFPTAPGHRSELSTAMGELTKLLSATNNRMAIDQLWRPALEKAEKHLANNPHDLLTLEYYGHGLCWYGGHGAPDSEECTRKALVAFETLVANSPGGRRHLRKVCDLRRWHGDLLVGAGRRKRPRRTIGEGSNLPLGYLPSRLPNLKFSLS